MTIDLSSDATWPMVDASIHRPDPADTLEISVARTGFAGQLCAFERVGRGAVLIDDSARLLEANACVRFGDGLQLVQGRLQAPQPTDRKRLRQFLGTILNPQRLTGDYAPTLTLPRPSGLRPWLLAGVDRRLAASGSRRAAAILLLITDVEAPASLPRGLLMQVFGLTLTEAQIARQLATGKSLREVSASVGISAGHARQRLKTIFDKTATRRQGELIALLAKLG